MKYQVETDIVMPTKEEKHLLKLLDANFYSNNHGWKSAKVMRDYATYVTFVWGTGLVFVFAARIAPLW